MARDDDGDFDDDDDASNSDHTYLTFLVGEEEYAVPVHNVTEIVRLQKTYELPDVPSYVRGVINLRGKVIPLLDVRSRFGMANTVCTDRTVIVVVELDDTSTGLVVDAVSEVTEILPETVESRRKIGHELKRSMVSGVGMRERGVIFLLDVPTVLAGATATPATTIREPGSARNAGSTT